MRRQHLAVVHLINMIAGQDQDELRGVMADDVHVLEHRIGRALVPLGLDALLRRHQVDELIELAAQEAPAALQVLDQAVRLVLGHDADAANTGIQAIGQREIDDAELAAERHRRFGAPVRQVLQAAAAAAGQNQRNRILRQQADEARILFLLA